MGDHMGDRTLFVIENVCPEIVGDAGIWCCGCEGRQRRCPATSPGGSLKRRPDVQVC